MPYRKPRGILREDLTREDKDAILKVMRSWWVDSKYLKVEATELPLYQRLAKADWIDSRYGTSDQFAPRLGDIPQDIPDPIY